MTVRVLVVEDEPRMRSALEEYFTLHGFYVLSTGDGDRAIEIGRQFQPRVLLCDWLLGGATDGVAVARALAEVVDGLQILFMTGHSRGNLGRACGGLPVRAVYQKPVQLSRLRTEIENISSSGAGNSRGGGRPS